MLAANGLICIGTESGKIYVYDFKQTLKCVCGNDALGTALVSEFTYILIDFVAKTVGPVTALALSHDHTYVAAGHSSGHIQLFDLHNPQVPARSVAPTTLAIVLSGRKEGHLLGSRILSIGFVAGRHTAIISADEHGLAFYHSLGKVLFVEASDTLRILGKYPKEDIVPLSRPTSASSQATPSGPTSSPLRGRKTRYTVLGMMPLPLGTSSHPTDVYSLVALLTPAKIVIVGLKPTPKTWFKRSRGETEEVSAGSKHKWKGTLAWFPSVSITVDGKVELNKKADSNDAADPMLAYSWGSTLYLMRASESKIKQTTRNSRTGKFTEIEVGNVVFEDVGKWGSEDIILALQWLNVNVGPLPPSYTQRCPGIDDRLPQQIVIVTSTTLEVYDVRISRLVERVQFEGLSLVSPSLSLTTNGAIPYFDSAGDVSHSMRAYKGKIFLLVSAVS